MKYNKHIIFKDLLKLLEIKDCKQFATYRAEFIKKYNLNLHQFGEIYVNLVNIHEYVSIILQWFKDTQTKCIYCY